MDEKDYNFFTNNCDHFATWCKTGEHRSIQVDDAKRIIVALGGEAGEIACVIHDIAQDFKAPALDSMDRIEKPKEILGKLDFNTDISSAIPPVQTEQDGQHEEDAQVAEYELVESELAEEAPPAQEKIYQADAQPMPQQESPPDEGDLPPPKKPWYERVGNFIKGLTYPISGALEVIKHHPKLLPLKKVPFFMIGAKVRNVIDKIVTKIKLFTGRITPEQAREEIQNNETALLGQTIASKQPSPIKEAVKTVATKVFGFLRK